MPKTEKWIANFLFDKLRRVLCPQEGVAMKPTHPRLNLNKRIWRTRHFVFRPVIALLLFLRLNSLPPVMKEYGFLSVCAVTPIGEPYSMQHTGEMRGSSELPRQAAGDR